LIRLPDVNITIITLPQTAMASLSLNLDEEARLYTTNAEREKYGLLATLFGIIVALDYLERAYVRDSVTAAEYVPPLESESPERLCRVEAELCM
jgi:hypothetical protein